MAACSEANDTPPDTRVDGLHQAPTDLNEQTRNIIKLYKPADGSAFSFVKRQCMHCLDPACAAGCPVPGAAQRSRERHRELDGGQVHRLPLLHDHLSVPRAALPVAGL